MDKKTKLLLNQKQKSISEGIGAPSPREGGDGDLTVRRIPGRGLFLYYKYKSKWYSTRLSLIKPKSNEDPVILPLKESPIKIGELIIDKDNNIRVGKDKFTVGTTEKNQVVTMNSLNTLDINEIKASRASTSGMGADAGGTGDLLLVNTTGHAHAHIQTQGSSYDPYLIFSYLTAGESVDLKQWVIGMDNSDSDTFNWMYKAAGTEPLTPSGTTATQKQMSLDTSGNLTTRGTLTVGTIASDTAGDNYLVEVSGEVKKRTPAQVLSDIGGGAITALNNATANELVTVGATTTELDAEANLTFDGYILKVKNTDVLKTQAQFIYDTGEVFSINVLLGGHTFLEATGDITISAAQNCINFKDGSNIFGEINMETASTMKLLGVSNYDVKVISQGTGDIYLESADDITISSSDILNLNSGDGTFTMKRAGTEFSVANSAYAGMILGYRCIGEDAVHASYTLTTSFAVPHADMTTRFIAPPSGNVEVMVQIFMNSSTSNKILYLGLSDNATYNSLGVQYEHNAQYPDETDDGTIQHFWTITGLTAGDTYNYWLGAKTSGTNKFLNWGGDSSGRYPDFIMKVVALPKAVSDFATFG